MMRVLAVCGAFLLPLVACGGSDDSSSDDATTQTEAPATEDGTVAEPDADAGSDDDSDAAASETTPPSPDDEPDGEDDGDGGGDDTGGSGPSTATATIGGETYEFSTEGAIVAQCQTDMFGIFSVQLPSVDGDGGIGIVALLEGTDPAVVEQVNAVEVSAGDEDWVADESSDLFEMSDVLEPGMSQVDSIEIDGSTVRGTATFVRQLRAYSGGGRKSWLRSFCSDCSCEVSSASPP